MPYSERTKRLLIPNTESNSHYLRCCQIAGVEGHPARFPQKLPEFFIKFLTEPGDVVLDIFAGSNTTGAAADGLGRRWIAFESNSAYLATSVFRFIDRDDETAIKSLHARLINGDRGVVLEQAPMQPLLI